MAGGVVPEQTERWTAPSQDRSPMTRVIVRVALLMFLLLIGADQATAAFPSSMGQLERDLREGRVTSMEIERPGPTSQVQGDLSVRWDAGLFDSYATYAVNSGDPATAGVDEADGLVERARAAGVDVTVVNLVDASVDRNGRLAQALGPGFVMVTLLAWAGVIIVLITGPQPWFATRWAWFWLASAVPLLWVVFLLVEPRPIWKSARLAAADREPLLQHTDQRLTGGWAFVIGWIIAATLGTIAFPGLNGWHVQ